MRSPFDRPSAALGCPACSLAVPGFLKPAVVGRVSGWVLVGLKLPVTPGNPRLKVGDAGGSGAWNRSGASVPAQHQSSSSEWPYKVTMCSTCQCSRRCPLSMGLVALLDRVGSRPSVKCRKRVNHAAAGLPDCRCWCFKTKTHLQAHLYRCQKCSNGFFGKSWPSVVFPNEVLNYSLS